MGPFKTYQIPQANHSSPCFNFVFNPRDLYYRGYKNNNSNFDLFPIFKDFKWIAMEDMTLLGTPILEGKTIDKARQMKITDLEQSIDHLSLLQAHHALCLLKNVLTMPKLLYILRTSPCAGNQPLSTFNNILRRGFSKILNGDLNNSQWTKASPFWLQLHLRTFQKTIMPETLHDREDPVVTFVLSMSMLDQWNQAYPVGLGYISCTQLPPGPSSRMWHASWQGQTEGRHCTTRQRLVNVPPLMTIGYVCVMKQLVL